ncbi:nitroreductase family protein [Sinorhizobium sp. A49]|uniref:nitroreductase family protein n=1 Tax=Sinorhizobium sp. A49 TaxID=1945861 RepID=UPI0009866E52|nr:nitroreductase family protein [Sinorhizobium sp. A49]OOG66971.1 nitroreductase family protein [Sinorhizobium sp. A49]
MRTHETLPYDQWIERSPEEMAARAAQFYEDVNRRRTTRYFSERPVPRAVIETCLLAAGSAPSGANHQPWHFTVIESPDIKAKVREAAEEEERVFYQQKAPQEWLDALAPLGTDEEKPFLETAPYLIAIFSQKRGGPNPGDMKKNYYVNESVGIATGILITALHHAGLATLTHTPAPMNFLNEICGRPDSEKPFLILVVGYPAPDATVPVAGKAKKPLEQISTWL